MAELQSVPDNPNALRWIGTEAEWTGQPPYPGPGPMCGRCPATLRVEGLCGSMKVDATFTPARWAVVHSRAVQVAYQDGGTVRRYTELLCDDCVRGLQDPGVVLVRLEG